MRDFELKNILSKLTGVSLTKVSSLEKEGMAEYVGQGNFSGKLDWFRFTPKNIPADFPNVAKNWISNKDTGFSTEYSRLLTPEEEARFEGMLFFWYAKDIPITDTMQSKLDALPENEENNELKRVAEFVKKNNIPILCTKEEIEFRMAKAGKSDEYAKLGYNGSSRHAKSFGKYWGISLKRDPETGNPVIEGYEPGIHPLGENPTPKQFSAGYNACFPDVPSNQRHDGEENDKLVHLCKVVLKPVGNTIGIFGQKQNGEIIPVLDESAKHNNSLRKIFNFNKEPINVGSSQFELSDVVNGVPTASSLVIKKSTAGRGRPGKAVLENPNSFRLVRNNDGGIYWSKNNQLFPITEQQSKQIISPLINSYKYLIGNNPVFAKDFASVHDKQAYEKDCQLLNKLRNLIISPEFNTTNISAIDNIKKQEVKDMFTSGGTNINSISIAKKKFGLTTPEIYEILVEDIPMEKRKGVFEDFKIGMTPVKISKNRGIDKQQVSYLQKMYFEAPVASGKLQVIIIGPSGSTPKQTGVQTTRQLLTTPQIQTQNPQTEETGNPEMLRGQNVNRRITVLHQDFDLNDLRKSNIANRASEKENKKEQDNASSYQEAIDIAVAKYGFKEVPNQGEAGAIEVAQIALDRMNQKFLERDPNARPNLIQEGYPENVEEPVEEPVVQEETPDEDFTLDEPETDQDNPGGRIFGKFNGFVKSSKDIINKLKKYN